MIRMSKQYELELKSLPFSRGDDQVIFIESSYNPEINDFIVNHIEDLKKIFAREFLDFCYVPEVCERFFEMNELDWHKMPYDRKLLRLFDYHLRTDEVFNKEVVTGEVEPTLICNSRGESIGNHLAFEAYHLDLSFLSDESLMMDQFRQIAKAYSRREAIDYRRIDNDEETVAMLREMDRLARALKLKGVKTQVFDDMIASLEQPSSLLIDYRGHLVLPELGNLQIRLNPMEKTLYRFFLYHPEGLLADEIVGHRKELLSIYEEVSIYDRRQRSEDAVDALLSEEKSTLYVNVSRIKSRLREKLGLRLSVHYIIEKRPDGRYGISLPRELVSYERKSWEPEVFFERRK